MSNILKKINNIIKTILIIILINNRNNYTDSTVYSILQNKNLEDLLSDDSNESTKIRKKIANVLSNRNNTDSIIIQNNNNSNIKYKNLEDLLSDDSSESIKIRKKIANVLSKKRNYLINNLGIIDSILLIPSFLFLDKKFNKDHLSQNEKQEVIKTYNEFSNEVKTAMLEILNKEVFNNNHIK